MNQITPDTPTIKSFFKLHFKEILLVILILCLALFFRLWNLSERINFSGDQAESSLRAFELWQNKEFTLVGPITSWQLNDLHAHTSSLSYYLQLLLLLPNNFDPLRATFTMAVIAALMIIPLYLGARKIVGCFPALFLTAIYALLPFFIDYTTFLWNPNFQLILAPLAIFTLGLYYSSKKNYWLSIFGFVLGLMLTLHYQFALALIGLLCFFLFRKKFKELLWLILGLIIGFSPVILLELNTSFYNTKILLGLLTNLGSATNGFPPLHYFMVSGFFLILFLTFILKNKITRPVFWTTLVFLTLLNIFIYFPKQKNSFSAPTNWFYQNELITNSLIVQHAAPNFNILNLAYIDPLANVQKYLIAIKTPQLYEQLSPSYYENTQLFIIAPKDYDFSKAINYEITTFEPVKQTQWNINPNYSLHLWER